MENRLITTEDPRLAAVLNGICRIEKQIGEVAARAKPKLSGERYMTDREVAEAIKISRRTLQQYRTAGKIPFYAVGGKTLYKESDIEKFMADGYIGKP